MPGFAAGIAIVTVALANAARTRGQITASQIALAVSITVSGVVYLLLLASLAAAAGPALVLLLIFIAGCGIIIGMHNGAASRRDS